LSSPSMTMNGWDWSGLLLDPSWYLFVVFLILTFVVYSYYDGGLVDCCLLYTIFFFVALITFLSVAPHNTDPVPIWDWSSNYSYYNLLTTAATGALIWGLSLGVASFAIGRSFHVIQKFVDMK